MLIAGYDPEQPHQSLVAIRTALFGDDSIRHELTRAIDGHYWETDPKSLQRLLERIQERG